MATGRRNSESPRPRRPPATTPEGREDQMIALSVDLAETQLRNGTASSAVITHFLKLGTTREKLEQEKLRRENLLLEAKANAVSSADRLEKLAEDAIRAMREYSGHSREADDADEEVLWGDAKISNIR